jgi:hypothetical protein
MLGVWPVSELLGIGHLSEAEREELRALLHRVAGDD